MQQYQWFVRIILALYTLCRTFQWNIMLLLSIKQEHRNAASSYFPAPIAFCTRVNTSSPAAGFLKNKGTGIVPSVDVVNNSGLSSISNRASSLLISETSSCSFIASISCITINPFVAIDCANCLLLYRQSRSRKSFTIM